MAGQIKGRLKMLIELSLIETIVKKCDKLDLPHLDYFMVYGHIAKYTALFICINEKKFDGLVLRAAIHCWRTGVTATWC